MWKHYDDKHNSTISYSLLFFVITILVVIGASNVSGISGKEFGYVMFNDSFDRADSATVGNGWVEYSESNGVASITNNSLYHNATGGSANIVTYVNVSSSDIDYIAYNITRLTSQQAYLSVSLWNFSNNDRFGYVDFHDSGNIRCYDTPSTVMTIGTTTQGVTHKIEYWFNKTSGFMSVYKDDTLLNSSCLYNLSSTLLGNSTTFRLASGSASAHIDELKDISMGLIQDTGGHGPTVSLNYSLKIQVNYNGVGVNASKVMIVNNNTNVTVYNLTNSSGGLKYFVGTNVGAELPSVYYVVTAWINNNVTVNPVSHLIYMDTYDTE